MRFRTTQTLDEVVIQALMRQGVPTVRSGWVSVSDGTVRPFSFDADGVARLDLGGLESDTFDLLLREFDQGAGRVGVADVQIGTLDLREFVQTPDDLMRRTELDDVVEQSPMSFSFTRVRNPTWFESLDDQSVRADEERVILRRFLVPGPRRFDLTGTASLTTLSEPSRIDEIVDAARERRCMDIGVRVHGDDMAARTALVRPRGTEFEIRSGLPFAVEGCESIALDSGWYLLEGGDPGPRRSALAARREPLDGRAGADLTRRHRIGLTRTGRDRGPRRWVGRDPVHELRPFLDVGDRGRAAHRIIPNRRRQRMVSPR